MFVWVCDEPKTRRAAGAAAHSVAKGQTVTTLRVAALGTVRAAKGGVTLEGRRDAFAKRVGRVLVCIVRTLQKRVGPVLDPWGGVHSNFDWRITCLRPYISRMRGLPVKTTDSCLTCDCSGIILSSSGGGGKQEFGNSSVNRRSPTNLQ
jgi:hypothetical protein